MARNRASSKAAGTSFETESSRYLTGVLGILVERMPRSGSHDKGDLRGLKFKSQPVVVECKNPGANSPLRIAEWWKETEEEIKNYFNAVAGVLLVKQFGKSLEESFVIVDDTNWNTLEIHNTGLPLLEVKSLPFDSWRDNVFHGSILKTSRRGSRGEKFWYVMTLRDATSIFDSINTLPQIFLTEIDLIVLAESGQVAVSTTTGQEITINASKEDMKKVFSPAKPKPISKKVKTETETAQPGRKGKGRRVITSSHDDIDVNGYIRKELS